MVSPGPWCGGGVSVTGGLPGRMLRKCTGPVVMGFLGHANELVLYSVSRRNHESFYRKGSDQIFFIMIM